MVWVNTQIHSVCLLITTPELSGLATLTGYLPLQICMETTQYTSSTARQEPMVSSCSIRTGWTSKSMTRMRQLWSTTSSAVSLTSIFLLVARRILQRLHASTLRSLGHLPKCRTGLSDFISADSDTTVRFIMALECRNSINVCHRLYRCCPGDNELLCGSDPSRNNVD